MQCHKTFRLLLLGTLISTTALLNAQSTVFINQGVVENGGVLGGVFIGLSSSITGYQPTTISGGAIGAPQLYWKDLVGIEQIGTTLTKTDLNGWGNAGATSATQIECFENGWVEYRVDNLQNTFAFGLSNSNTDAGFESIEYAMMLDAGQLRVYNYGQLKGDFGSVALNDVVRIERMGNILFYSKNNIVLFNHQVDPIEHLLTDIALFNQGAAVIINVNSKESFKSPLVLRNKGCYINIKTGTSLVVGGKINLENTGQFDNSGKINLKGNWNNNSETPAFANYLSVRSDVVEFSGVDQTIGGTSATIFNDVIWSGSGRKIIGDGSPPVFNGNVTIQEAGTGTIILVNQSKNPVPVSVKGNLTVPRGSIFENNGTGFSISNNLVIDGTYSGAGGLFFSGSNAQTISGVSVPVINNLNINKSGGSITLNTPLTIGSILTLTKGILITDNIKVLTVNQGATVSGASDSAYVSGPVQKIGNTAFTFPLGDVALSTGAYHPITITAPALASDAFTAEYKAENPFLIYENNLETDSLDEIVECEYFILNRNSGRSIVVPTIGWSQNNCNPENTAELGIAAWDGSQWKSLGYGEVLTKELTGTIKAGFGLNLDLTAIAFARINYPRNVADCCGDKITPFYASTLQDIYGSPYTYLQTEYKGEPAPSVSKTHRQRTTSEPNTYQEFSDGGNLTSELSFLNIAYSDDDLLKETVTDEEGNVTETFKDKFGQLIATRTPIGHTYTFDTDGNIVWNTGSNVEFATTYFIYDLAGHLLKTIDPENKESNYFYNSIGELIKEISPDKGTIEYRYDKFGRLRFVKDNNDANAILQGTFADLFTYNKYDKWGRVFETGKVKIPVSNVLVFNDVTKINDQNYPLSTTTGVEIHKVLTYDNNKVDNSINRLAKETVYSNHTFFSGIYQPGNTDEYDYTYTNNGQLKSKTFTFSDFLLFSQPKHQLLYTYNLAGLPVTSQYKNLSNPNWDFIETIDYDDLGRVLESKSGKNTSTLFTDARYKYDAMGNLFVKSLCKNTGNTANPFREYVANNYNIRGQQTLQIAKNFRYKLDYDLRNNIASQTWSNNYFDNTSGTMPFVQHRYDYYYDPMNRLVGANYKAVNSTNNPYQNYAGAIIQTQNDFTCFQGAVHPFKITCSLNVSATSIYPLDVPMQGVTYPTAGRKYDTEYDYSKSGNFTQLNRYDNNALNTSQAYTYTSGKNQLNNVLFNEPSGTITAPYNYDGNGNLTSDTRSLVNTIDYNPFNMAVQIQKNNGDIIKYRYDASNQRTIKLLPNLLKEFYVGGVVVNENGKPKRYTTGTGYVELDNANNLIRKYTINDWLGNLRMVINETGTIVSSHDHYPYGKLMPMRVFESDVEGKRYQFTGQEHDPETEYDYFGARYYNRELGRYLSLDPLQMKFASFSPYNYVLGNPIRLVDPDGKAPQDPPTKNLEAKPMVYSNAPTKDFQGLIQSANPRLREGSPIMAAMVDFSADIWNLTPVGALDNLVSTANNPNASKLDVGLAGVNFVIAGISGKGPKGRLGPNEPPQRIQGPWTKGDLNRAANGKGPIEIIPTKNKVGQDMPLELHHGDQMPGSGVHEVPPWHPKTVEHPNTNNQGVTPKMRKNDAQLHWQMRGQEMGNPPPQKQN